MPIPDQQTLIIPETLAGERLDQALTKLLPTFSRTQIQSAIQAGHVCVCGAPAKSGLKIKGGETITYAITPKLQPAYEAEAIPLTIVYEDDAFIIINKPIGLVVHPGAGNRDKTLLNALLHHCQALHDLPRAGILHRLDKETSGLLVVAKTPHALKHLTAQLKKRTLLREYQAIVNGTLISGGSIDAPIERHHTKRTRMSVSDTGKPAVTHYRVSEKFRAHTRLTLRLETGRTHQIRVHLLHIRHPIVGDPTYGGRMQIPRHMSPELIQMIRAFKHQALHAFALGLTHPDTGEWMRFEIDLPADMVALLKALRADTLNEKKR